jgi:hypothetical protein
VEEAAELDGHGHDDFDGRVEMNMRLATQAQVALWCRFAMQRECRVITLMPGRFTRLAAGRIDNGPTAGQTARNSQS